MKIAVVTGASSGMGREFVKAVDREFALDEIWVIARRKERLESLRLECKTAIRPLAWDLSDPASFLLPETPHTYSTFVWQQNTYRTRNQAVNFRLIPLYDVLDEPYTVCFSALTPLSGK